MPTTLSADTAIVSAQDLLHALQNPEPLTPFTTVQSDQAATLATLSENFLHRANSVSCSPPTSLTRVRKMPAPSDPPLRVPATSTALPGPLPSQAPAHQRPSIIEPDDNNPVPHWYHLRSQTNLAELLPSHQQANSVIDSATGNVHKYRHLARGPDKAIWIKNLSNYLERLAQGVGS